MPDSDLLTLSQAAQLCGLKPSTLRRQAINKRLHAVKRPAPPLGEIWYVTRAELERYLASRWVRTPREADTDGR